MAMVTMDTETMEPTLAEQLKLTKQSELTVWDEMIVVWNEVTWCNTCIDKQLIYLEIHDLSMTKLYSYWYLYLEKINY